MNRKNQNIWFNIRAKCKLKEIIMKCLLFREIRIIKFKEIRKIVLFYCKKNIRINYQRILEDNIEVYDLE